MSNKISKERKTIYYVGLGLVIVGVILFISSFFIGFSGSGMHHGMPGFGMGGAEFDMGMPKFFKIGLSGMISIIAGGVMMNVGAKGAAGSGILLDPEQAREDLKPFSSAAGGMINDVIENIDMVKNKEENTKESNQVIRVRCRACGELNDEDAKFCKSCGERM